MARMWNQFRTDEMTGMWAGTDIITGGGGDSIHAYIGLPDGPGPHPGVVLVAAAPGWDEYYREFTRRWTANGYIAIAPNIFERFGHGTPDDVAARVRGNGGLSDASVIADAEAAMKWVKAHPKSNGNVGITGTCSGGRHALLVASSVEGFGAVGDLWGGNVVQAQTDPLRPVAPIDLTPNLTAPLIGLFGNDDRSPSPEQVDRHEEALRAHGKTYVFHRYDGAGHGFFHYHTPAYRPQAAMDGWNKLVTFFNEHLQQAA